MYGAQRHAERERSSRPRSVTTDLEVRDAPGRAPGVLGDALLQQEDGGGDHADAPVPQLLGLELAELDWVRRRKAEGVEPDLAGRVAVADGRFGRAESLLRAWQLAEGDLNAIELAEGDSQAQ